MTTVLNPVRLRVPEGAAVAERAWPVDGARFPRARGALCIGALPPGGELAPHRLDGAESALYLLDGSGRLGAANGDEPLKSGQGAYHPAGATRAFRADHHARALLLEIFIPVDGSRGLEGSTLPRLAPDPTAGHGRAVRSVRDRGDGALGAAGGFSDMEVDWLVTDATTGSVALTLATSVFEPGGSHRLHRHTEADEFFLVVEGSGEHLTVDGPLRVETGSMVYIPAGDWHGYRTDPGVTTRAVYGYLGAAGLAAAGCDLLDQEANR